MMTSLIKRYWPVRTCATCILYFFIPFYFLDFVTQLSIASYNQGQIDYLKRTIEDTQLLLRQRIGELYEHQTLIVSVSQLYADIQATYARMREEIDSLGQVKEKIKFSQSSSMNLAHGGKQTLNNTSLSMSIDGFNASRENVLSSTKLGNSTLNPNVTWYATILKIRLLLFMIYICRLEPQVQPIYALPQHINELSVFLKVPAMQLDNLSIYK